MSDIQIYSGTVDEAVAFVIQKATVLPVNVVVEDHLGGGQVGVTAGAVFVSREVHGAILALISDPKLRPASDALTRPRGFADLEG